MRSPPFIPKFGGPTPESPLPMKLKTPAARAALVIAVASLCAPLVAQAQNIATVNGNRATACRLASTSISNLAIAAVI